MQVQVKEVERVNWSAIIVVVFGTFMALLNSSSVNVAIPKLMTVFGASQDSIQWVLTGYMLSLAVVMPAAGYLADRYGYKRVFIIALSLFTVGSALSGLAWNVSSLVAARVIQAIGGGVMQPLSMALIYRNTPRNKIGTVLGIWGIAAMAAPAVGPTLGGYLVDYVGWRTIFYANIPVAILDLFLAFTYLEETPSVVGKEFDKYGLLSSSVGFFCLLLALSKGASKGWTSPFILSLLLISAVALTFFVIVELSHPEPIMELRLFKNFVFTLSLVITSVISIGMFGAIFLMPIYLQNVMGVSAMKSGLITMPSAIATAVAMPVAGRIFDKYGAKIVALPGLAVITVTTYMMHRFSLVTPFSWIIWLLVVRAIGMGLSLMPVTTAGTNTVPLTLIGRASSLNNVIRQVMSSFGIAMFTTIMNTRQAVHFTNLAQGVSLSGSQAAGFQAWMAHISQSMGWTLGVAKVLGLAVVTKHVALLAMAESIADCYEVAAGMCFVALVLCFFLRDQRPVSPRLSS